MFLDFVDNNSAPNGRKEGSHGKTYYFNPKFSVIRSPNKSDPQFGFKCRHSVYMSLTVLLKVWKESQLVHSILGYNSIVLTLEYVLIVQIIATHAKNIMSRFLELVRLLTDLDKVAIVVKLVFIAKKTSFQNTQDYYNITNMKLKIG